MPRVAPYNERIERLPGDPPVAYRPGVVIVNGRSARRRLTNLTGRRATPIFDKVDDGEEPELRRWFLAERVADAPAVVERLVGEGRRAQLDIVYFANGACCGVCPPHPALAVEIAANPWGANPWGANPWGANPWGANPWGANPWGANPWGANPWGANPEMLNLLATGKPPMSSAMPAFERQMPTRPKTGRKDIVIGVLDSGLAGGRKNKNKLRPDLLGLRKVDLARISGTNDYPSQAMHEHDQADGYLDPVAGHGTFIAGIIEQLTPGCTIVVRKVFHPEGDVSVSTLATTLRKLVKRKRPDIVNFSFGGTGTVDGLFEERISKYHEQGIVFVGSAGNEGSCVDQYPAALPEVVSVAALGPNGPAPWTNYGSWVDASAPGSNLVSSFFAEFDGALPPINGVDPDEFVQWATWSGTSFAGPVLVAALAREMATTNRTAAESVESVVRAPHLARFPNMGTIVNF